LNRSFPVYVRYTTLYTKFFLLTLSFNVSYSVLWSLCYFWSIFYMFGIFITLLYLVSNIKNFFNFTKLNTNSSFTYLSGLDLYWFLITPLALIFLLNLTWVGPSLSTWFGHILFTSVQYKFTYFITFFFTLTWSTYVSSFYYSSKEVYDFTSVTFSLFIWLVFIFYSNNIFTMIFFIEVLSTLIMLLVVTSTFSTSHFYNNLNLSSHGFFQLTTPYTYLNSIIFFFWISLIGSLNLFFFLILFFIKFLTFDWFLCEYVFNYLINTGLSWDIFFMTVAWFNLVFCIFLKCGLPPFFFWKPTFFKGLPLHTLYFYTFFFYFHIFIFFIYFFLNYVSDIFYFNINVHLVLLFIGLITLTFILCESYYIKAFIALSSILNSLFIFLTLSGLTTTDIIPSF